MYTVTVMRIEERGGGINVIQKNDTNHYNNQKLNNMYNFA